MLTAERLPVIALGADLKGAFVIERGGEVIHRTGFGDLSDPDRFDAWSEAIRADSGGAPFQAILIDRHPLYHSSAEGRRLAARDGARLVEIQHHHAHAAAVLEHARSAPPALGLMLDGTGFGDDGTGAPGTIWGCELLLIRDDGGMERLGHLRTVSCPGGDRAAREPWRMALSWMKEAGLSVDALPALRERAGAREWDAVWALAGTDAAPRTSSAGRLFDAVAAILGIRSHVEREAEAAVALEECAHKASGETLLPYRIEGGILDLAPMFQALIAETNRGAETALLANSFHATLIEGLARLVEQSGQGIGKIVLGGGCLLNSILAERLPVRLTEIGCDVRLPPLELRTDDAIPLGQLWVHEQATRRG